MSHPNQGVVKEDQVWTRKPCLEEEQRLKKKKRVIHTLKGTLGLEITLQQPLWFHQQNHHVLSVTFSLWSDEPVIQHPCFRLWWKRCTVSSAFESRSSFLEKRKEMQRNALPIEVILNKKIQPKRKENSCSEWDVISRLHVSLSFEYQLYH